MKVFASDLDQTLIYSSKWTESSNLPVTIVEEYQGYTSYMTMEGCNKLKELYSEFEFIPITTRTRIQYERIKLPVKPRLAVVANGAVIINDDKEDPKWKQIIETELANCLSLEEVQKLLSTIENENGLLRIKNANNHFMYIITDVDVFNYTVLDTIEKYLNDGNWSIHNQGRKVYFIPNVISKGRALEYLKNEYKLSKIVAAGDSLLDEPMNKISDYFIVPEHSKLLGDYKCNDLGIESGLEIINTAYKYLGENI